MSYFYSKQLEALVKQCIRVFSNFSYKTGESETSPGQLLPIPCKYGDASRMVAQILKNNSENTAISAPIIAVYIAEMEQANDMRNSPASENTLYATERAIDPTTGRYTNEPGSRYEINRLMPVPFRITIKVDFLFSNVSQQWQFLEQVCLLFNPSIDIQFNENPFDWSALTRMELKNIDYNTRSVPMGNDDSLNVTSFTFEIPFWLNPPAKIKKVYTIETIVADMGRLSENSVDTWGEEDFTRTITSAFKNKIHIANNTATLLGQFGDVLKPNSNDVYSWKELISSIGKYKDNTTILKLRPVADIAYANKDISAYFSFHPSEENKLNITYIQETLPLPTIDDIHNVIDPRLIFPGNNLSQNPATGTRLLILKEIIPNTVAWGAFAAPENAIIEWNGTNWEIAFDPTLDDNSIGNIVKNTLTNEYYVLTSNGWVTAISGYYNPGFWSIEFWQEK